MKSPGLKFPLLLLFCVYAQLSNARDINQGIRELQALAGAPEMIEWAMEQDGRLNIEQIFVLENNWKKQPSLRISLLAPALQNYITQLVKALQSPFDDLLLIGTQGETLAVFPVPDEYWYGDQAAFVNVMAEESVYLETNKTLDSPRIAVPIKDQYGEIFGVLRAHLKAN